MITKTLLQFNRNIMACVEEQINASGPEAQQLANDHCNQTFRTGVDSVTDEARAEWQKHVTHGLMEKGYSAKEIEAAFEHTWKKILNLQQSVQPKIKATGKWMMAKLVAGLMFAGWALTAVTGYHGPETPADRDYRAMKAQGARDEEMQSTLALIAIPEDQFNMMIGGIAAAPSPVADPETLPAQAAPVEIPAAQAMPIVVAAIAAAPINVEVTTDNSHQVYTTTVGTVYRNAPAPVQNRIEQHAIQHDYNTDNSAAFAAKLKRDGEDWSRKNFPQPQNNTNNIHVDAVDGSGRKFGSANFHQ